jgi:hypothetical protein
MDELTHIWNAIDEIREVVTSLSLMLNGETPTFNEPSNLPEPLFIEDRGEPRPWIDAGAEQ